MIKLERNTTFCDWCQGHKELFHNRFDTVATVFDAETGNIVVSIFPKEFDGPSRKANGKFNYCPMCGRKL